MNRNTISRWLSLAVFLSAGLFRVLAGVGDVQQVKVAGYFLTDRDGQTSFLNESLDDIEGLSVSPMTGTVPAAAMWARQAQSVFTATVPFGYKITEWRYDYTNFVYSPRGVELPGSANTNRVSWTYAADGGSFVFIAPVLAYDDRRTVTVAKSPFGAGRIESNVNTNGSVMKGDLISLKAVPTRDEKTGFDHSAFRRWSDGVTDYARSFVVDTNVALVAEFVPNTWRVTFDPFGGEVFPTSKVVTCDAAYGWLPTPERTGYYLLGWSRDRKEGEFCTANTTVGAVGDHTLYARWEVKVFTVDAGVDETSVNCGTVTGGGEYAYGSAATLTAIPGTGFMFTGWTDGVSASPREVSVVSNATYRATFGDAYYDVTFSYYAENGSLTNVVRSVKYGEAATPPPEGEASSHFGCPFEYWSTDAYRRVTEPMTVTAVYKDEFAVRFSYRDRDGNAVTSAVQGVRFGQSATPPPDSVCDIWENHELIGWSPDYRSIGSDCVITAEYIEIFDVRFAYRDRKGFCVTGEVQRIKSGCSATPPSDSVCDDWEGHELLGWEPDYHLITSNCLITAQYGIVTFEVVFKYYLDELGVWTNVLQTVAYGEAAVPPPEGEASTSQGLPFQSWSTDEYLDVTRDLKVTAQYDKTFAVRFIYLDRFGNTVTGAVQRIQPEGAATPPSESVCDDVEGCELVGWEPDYHFITSNCLITAQYRIRTFKVVFRYYLDEPGVWTNVTQAVAYGEAAVPPPEGEASTSQGLPFKRWSTDDYLEVTDDLKVTAQYETEFKVRFVYRDGFGNAVTGALQRIEPEGAARPPSDSECDVWEGYELVGWEPDYRYIVSNCLIVAQYVVETNDVVFSWYDDSCGAWTNVTQAVAYGEAAVPPPEGEASTSRGLAFKSWSSVDYRCVTCDLTITATYETSFRVRFAYRDRFGNAVTGAVQRIQPEGAATPPSDSVCNAWDGHELIGWDPDYHYITSDATIAGVYSGVSNRVVFSWYDEAREGWTNESQTVAYGEAAVPPAAGEASTSQGLPFQSWSTDEYLAVTRDLEVTAQYETTFAVCFAYRDRNGDAVTGAVQRVAPGSYATPPPDKVCNIWEGHNLLGWHPDYSAIWSDTVVTAEYDTDKYKVVFCYCDETGMEQQHIEYPLHGEQVSFVYANGVKNLWPGHEFIAWSVDGKDVVDDYLIATGNMQVVARYEGYARIDYRGGDGGEGEMAEQVFTNKVGQVNLRPNAFTRTGYTFTEWTDADGNSYADRARVTISDGMALALTANWQPITYTVALDGNGGELSGGKMVGGQRDPNYKFPLNCEYDEEATLYFGNGTVPTGCFDLDGLGTNRTTVLYRKNADTEVVNWNPVISNLTTKAGAPVTLYAIWKKAAYEVSFNGNGATSGSMENQLFAEGEVKALSKNQFTRDGYSFSGWATEEDGALTYTDGQSVSNLATSGIFPLYAVWEKGSSSDELAKALFGGTVPDGVTVTSNPTGAWTSPESGQGLQRTATSTAGTLMISVPGAGTLCGTFAQDKTPNQRITVTCNGEKKNYTPQTITLSAEYKQTIEISGTPTNERTWTLSDFKWTPSK